MSKILTTQIKNHIKSHVAEHLDLTDCPGDENKQNTRGLVSICIRGLSNLDYKDITKYIVDGPRDNGIDGIFFDEVKNKLFIIQSKWSNNGTGTIETGELHKFITGTYHLLNESFEKFNPRVKIISSEISSSILRDPHIVLVVTYNSGNPLSSDCQNIVQEFLNENNSESQEVVSFQSFNLDKIVRTIRNSKNFQKTNVEANLLHWGEQKYPYYSIYGKISCADIAEWHKSYGDLLTSENIRNAIPDSEINIQIEKELKKSPELFWYLNNGITAIADEIRRKPAGLGEQRESGYWNIENIKIVNGAQTTGAISRAYATAPTQVQNAYVQIKIISLEKSPLDIAEKITTATNTQNRVESKDFLALDPIQESIREFFWKNGISYTFKRGVKPTSSEKHTDVTELAAALAISSTEMSSVTIAKRNFGSLTDPDGHYKKLFTPSTNYQNFWDLIAKLRSAEDVISEIQKKLSGRDEQLIVHGNRFIQHILINHTRTIDLKSCTNVFNVLKQTVKETFGEDCYLAVLFKNTKKCEKLKEEILSTMSLF